MKISCGSLKEKEQRRDQAWRKAYEWHDFFCLMPRRLGDTDCRWLETIETRRRYIPNDGLGDIVTEFRAKPVQLQPWHYRFGKGQTNED